MRLHLGLSSCQMCLISIPSYERLSKIIYLVVQGGREERVEDQMR